jgi:RNA polymerase sigma-70 factor (ECF subfamily)
METLSSESTAAEISDATLLARIAAGDFPAFQTFHQRHAGRLAAFARRLSRDHDLAEDIVQEVFLAVWIRAETFRPERGDATGWLYSLARHRVIDHWRRTGKAEVCPLDGVQIAREDEEAERAFAVRQALSVLDSGPRRAIQMAYYEGLSYQEVARRLAVPEGTLKSRIRAGLRAMRSVLAERRPEAA